MPKKNRLTGAEIRRQKPAKRLISSLFSLSVTMNEAGTAKAACVVSKKVSPKAVVRNTLKRRMRSALNSCGVPTGASLILTAKKQAVDVPYTALRDDVAELLTRLRSGK